MMSSVPVQATPPPNVLLILADDLAVGDLGSAASSNLPSRTPRLDQFAREAVCFDQAYSASCVCAPARAALLTGRYPHRTGVVTLNMNTYPAMTRLHRDERTLADFMQDAGYVTGLIGKWHIGRGPGYEPNDRGFQECESFDGSGVVGYFDYVLNINGEPATFRGEDHYLSNELTARAISYVRRHQNEPFFLHLAHYAPHRPLEAPPTLIHKFRDQGFDESTATIYAMIEVMDTGIGKLLDELEALKISENTIVIFASDNGPDPIPGERFNGVLRGTKYQCYEGGIRVPLMVRFGDHFQPGRRKQVVSFIDVVPTIAELCGLEITPAKKPIDGESYAAVLAEPSADFEPTRFWQWNRGKPNYTHNAAMRQGRFKLVRPFVTRGSRVKDSTLPYRLYDLAEDPAETNDLSGKLNTMARDMDTKLQQWADKVEQDRER